MKKQIALFLTLFLLVSALTGCNSLASPLQTLLTGNSAAALPDMAASGPTAESNQLVGRSTNSLTAIEAALESIYDEVNPAVVNIQVTQKQEMSPLPMPDFPGFRFFFGPQFPQEKPQEPQEFYQHGLGSGFVWDKQGHIVTNNHVVAEADKIQVTFADGLSVPAEVVGADPDSDLAVLKVDVSSDHLHPVTLADSNQVKVGQLVAAIGNPFGLEGTMTVGIISALDRSIPATTADALGLAEGPTFTIPEIIQTDAPINPGNSGGVLVNDQGQVIGVTAAIESPVRASAGIGFAIPSAIVQKVVPALIKDGHYEHPWLGLSGMSLTPELAEAMNLKPDQYGALVIEVTPDSPADKASLHGSDRQVKIDDLQARIGGDVIIAIDKQPVQEFDDLVSYLVRSTKVNQEVTLTILREGKEQQVKVKLATRPKAEEKQRENTEDVAGQAWLGIEGVTLTPEIAQAMSLPTDQEGVLIEQVELDSPADQAGLHGSYKPTIISGHRLPVGGDVITAIDGQPVSRMEELQTFIQNASPGQDVVLTLLRDGKQVKVTLILSERPESTS